jgi:Ca2+-binding RTX toxin-like protein
MTRNSLLAAATAAAALAAFPAAASAAPAVTVSAANRTIAVAGDNTSENITIAEAGGFITVDGAPTAAPSDGTFTLTASGGDGNDTITLTAAGLSSAVITGDDGEDTLTGGPNNDRIIGGDDNDTMAGGNGNDTLVWNPGDDTDVMDGQGGADDIELNGGGNAENFAASPNADRVIFERVSPAGFQLNVGTAERLVLNANGGNDTMVSNPAVTTAMLLNGGDGVDSLQAGGGADFVNGGDGNDGLEGGPGGDRLVGDRGADTMRGGAGADTTVWNNGDGSDVMDGEDGLDKVEVNGAGAAEVFTIATNGAREKFDRTNIGPFSLDIATAELLDLRALGGDDSFTAAPGTRMAVLADGGDGNDALTGAEEPDSFFGGVGNDTLTGNGGPDMLDGQDGDDALMARDGAGDLARGGAGTDSAQVDLADVVDGVETVDRPAVTPADETATAVDVGRRANVQIRRGRARTRITLTCPAAEAGGCEGRLTLLTARRFRAGRVSVPLVLASARYDLDAGERTRITLRLPRGVQSLARNRQIAAVAQTVSRDAVGNVAEDSARVTMRLQRRR